VRELMDADARGAAARTGATIPTRSWMDFPTNGI